MSSTFERGDDIRLISARLVTLRERIACEERRLKTLAPKRFSRRIDDNDEIVPEYDFSGGVRGKYAKRYAEGTNLILLEPDLAAEFPDSRSVSPALRAYLKSKSKRRTA